MREPAATRTHRAIRAALLAVSMLLAAGSPAPAGKADVRPAVGSREDAELLAVLVRTHLIALHQANVTGNYTVLRDLGSAEFRDQFSPGDLAVIFEPLREEGIGLQAAAVLQPEISQAPTIDARGVMRVRGRFATRPQAVDFDFAFRVEGRVWRLTGLSVVPYRNVIAGAEIRR